ncbi:MAG: HAD-IIIA family hydrolase [Oscillospiraceae bacterium]|nr:HAD-IIIA family hydrolase [Oscillospiraceae bacterium]
MKTVIAAGGFGTRISALNPQTPKVMTEINGKSVLLRQIEALREQGFRDFIITVGHLSEKIIEYFGGGGRFGVNISYYEEKEALGSAGALFRLKDKLTENFIQDFVFINGDIVFDVDFKKFYDFHESKNAVATIFAHPNSHPFDSVLIAADESGRVTDMLYKRPENGIYYKNLVNAGLHILSPLIFDKIAKTGSASLDCDILKPLLKTRGVYSYKSAEYAKDMGTPERLAEVKNDLKSGLPEARSLRSKRKAVFLDRDGTVNAFNGLICNPQDLTLIGGAAEAVRKINKSGYLALIITNQPGISMGKYTFGELAQTNSYLETLLGNAGAYIDGLYFCPHYPVGGYEDELPQYKIDCECRKPKAGMLFKAAEELNIDLSQSYMVGDSEKDIKAGKAAGCKPVFIKNGAEEPPEGDFPIYENILDFVNMEII